MRLLLLIIITGRLNKIRRKLDMGWSDCGTDYQGRPIGYAHGAKCDHPGCNKDIDRGLSYACGGHHGSGNWYCDEYYCSEHLIFTDTHEGIMQLCPVCHNTAVDYENSCQICDHLDSYMCGGSLIGQCKKMEHKLIDEITDEPHEGIFAKKPDWCPLNTEDDREIRDWIDDLINGYEEGEHETVMNRILAYFRNNRGLEEATLDRIRLESMSADLISMIGIGVRSTMRKGDPVRDYFFKRVLTHFESENINDEKIIEMFNDGGDDGK